MNTHQIISETCIKNCSASCTAPCEKRIKAALWGVHYSQEILKDPGSSEESERLKNWAMALITAHYLELPKFVVHRKFRRFFQPSEIEEIQWEAFFRLFKASQDSIGDLNSQFWTIPLRFLLGKLAGFQALTAYDAIKKRKMHAAKMEQLVTGAEHDHPVFSTDEASLLFDAFRETLISENLIRISGLMTDLSGKWTRKEIRIAYLKKFDEEINLTQAKYALGQIRRLFRDFLEYRAKFGRRFES